MKKVTLQIALLSIFLVITDQVSKYWIVQNGFFIKNDGIAFGIDLPMAVILTANIVLLAYVSYLFAQEFNLKNKISQIALAMIIGGGIGNLIDRLMQGYVVDFIFIWSYPAFNLADVYITLGVLLILAFYGRIRGIKKHT